MISSSATQSCFHFPISREDYDENNNVNILNEISNPLSSIPRLQGKIHKASVSGHLSVATILSNAFAQPAFPKSSYAVIQCGQLGLTFYQFDLISRRLALILSSLVMLPGSDFQVNTNYDGDSVIMLLVDDDYVDEQLVVLIVAILRLGATYMVVKREDILADFKAWKQLISLVEPILVVTASDANEMPVSIRNELNIVSREDFEDYEEQDEVQANSEDSFSNLDMDDSSYDNPPPDTLSLIKKIRSSLILKPFAFVKPTTISCKVVWDLALELKVVDKELQVQHFKSDVTMGQRTAFIFQCYETSGKIQWCRLGHRTVRNRISWERMEFPMESNERYCLTFPLNDPRSLIQIFTCFIHGKTLIIGANEDFNNEEALVRKLGTKEMKHIKRLEVTPIRLHKILEVAAQLGLESSLSHVKTWFVSGSFFPPSLAKHFFQMIASTDTILVPMYGKAEVVWCATWNMFSNISEVNKWSFSGSTKLAMGIPISNTNVVIMDERKVKFCHYGQKGEICLMGCMVPTNGYCGAPIIGGKHGSIFRTGDLGRIIQDRWGTKQLLVETSADSKVLLDGKLVDLEELSRQVKQDALIKDSFAFVCRRGRDTPTIVVAMSSKDPKKLNVIKEKVFSMEPRVSSCFHINNIPSFSHGQVDLKQLRAAYFKYLGRCGPKQWDAILQSKRRRKSTNLPISFSGLSKNIQIVCKAVAFSLGVSVDKVIKNFDKSFWDVGGTPLRAIMTVKSCLCQGKKLAIEDFAVASTLSDLATRLTFAEKDEAKWNHSVYFIRKSYVYPKMTRNDRKDLTNMLAVNVSQIVDQRSYKEAEKYVAGLLNVFDNNLSIVAFRPETHELLGVAFNYKGNLKTHYMPAKVEEGLELFSTILQSCRHLTKGIEPKYIAKSYLISLKVQELSPIQTILVTRDLINESVKSAASAGCKGYILCTIDPLVQEICCSLLGFEILTEAQVNLYKNKKLQKPYVHLDDHQMVGAYLKRFSTTSK